MPIYEVGDTALKCISETSFSHQGIKERSDLQRLLRDQIEIVEEGLLVIAEEFGTWEGSRRRIDLLAIDKLAKLVVIELKIDHDGSHMELQAVRYAAMVSTMTFAQAEAAYRDYQAARGIESDAQQDLLDFLEWDEPDEESFGQSVRVILVSPDFSSEITTAVLWLNDQGLDLRCVQARPHAYQGTTLLDIRQIIPLPEAADMQVRVREKARAERQSRTNKADWTGVWYANVGMSDDNSRNWQACREAGFLSAGGGAKYSTPLLKLKVGSIVAAYQKGAGYLGIGRVTQVRTPIEEVRWADGARIGERYPGLLTVDEDPELKEYAVGIEWLSSVPLEMAKTFNGVFANQNIVCKLLHPATLSFLEEQFGGWENGQDS